jgi:putative ABC transport system ATP-binding protein
MTTGEAVLTLENVSKVYGGGEAAVHALRSVSLVVRRGEYVAIIGPSGSGKSTLMNILGCLDVPSSGRYLFSGEDVSQMADADLARVRNERIGFVFQQFHLLKRMSAWRNVELPLLYRRARSRRSRAMQALGMVGLERRVNHLPNELSGGQQQRVAIARALVTDPELILADEPTGNLDTTSTAEILEILNTLHRNGRTIVLITHDPEIAATAERVVSIRDGELTEGGSLLATQLAGHARPAPAAAAPQPAARAPRRARTAAPGTAEPAPAAPARRTRRAPAAASTPAEGADATIATDATDATTAPPRRRTRRAAPASGESGAPATDATGIPPRSTRAAAPTAAAPTGAAPPSAPVRRPRRSTPE